MTSYSDEANRIRNANIIVRTGFRRIKLLVDLGRIREAHETSRKITGALRVLAEPQRKSRRKIK